MSRLAKGWFAAAGRVLLCVLAILLVAMPVTNGDVPGVWTGEEAEEGCECCPDKTPGDGEDCCDTDGGACCARGVSAALMPTTARTEQAQPRTLETRALFPNPLFVPRANGPPPTPPPIA